MSVLKPPIPARRRRLLTFSAACVAASGLAWLIARDFVAMPAVPLTATSPQRVSTALPQRRLLRTAVNVPGIWIAREGLAIGSTLDGLRVVEVTADVGDTVSSGQVLARLESKILDSQARQAEHAARRALAEFAQAKEQYERANRLLPAGAVSRQDFEAARATMLAAQAAWQQAQAATDEPLARQAQAEIRAPFAGVITQRAIQVGAVVDTQTTLFRLASDRPPEFLAQIPQQFLPDLKVGMTAQISTSGRQDEIAGTVRLIGPDVDASTGYGQSRIAMAASVPFAILPGSAGNARITVAQRDVLAVDVRALRYGTSSGRGQDANAPYVFVLEAGRVKRTPVQVGARDGRWVEVRAGLDGNSPIVVAGATLLQDGDAVQTQDTRLARQISAGIHETASRRELQPGQQESPPAAMPAGDKA